MGVKHLAKLISTSREIVSAADIKEYTLAIDISCKIYESHFTSKLTDDPLNHIIKVIFDFLSGLLSRSNRPICVFDNKTKSPLKCDELKKRAKVINKYRDEHKKIELKSDKDDDDYNKLEELKRKTYLSDNIELVITKIQEMMNKLGVGWCISPESVDAEQYCAYLYNTGLVHAVMTQDIDCIVFNAPMFRKLRNTKTAQYEFFHPKAVCEKLQITHDQLIEVAVALGCDYHPKGVRGIGPVRVIEKIKSGTVTFQDDHKIAIAKFKAIPTKVKIEIPTRNLSELIDFLSSKHGMNKTYVIKRLDKIEIFKKILKDLFKDSSKDLHKESSKDVYDDTYYDESL